MNKYTFQHNYFNTYYYSNIINNVLDADFEVLGFIDSFFNDQGDIMHYLARPYQKDSAFHAFIFDIISRFFDEDMCNHDQKNFRSSLYAENVFATYGMEGHSFEDLMGKSKPRQYSEVEKYHDELRLTGWLEELCMKITNEVFYILFNNREVLLKFNILVADHMDSELNKEIEDEEIRALFNTQGYVQRVSPPEWCRRAVFYRDRGRCCLCQTDLTGLISIATEDHFDDIVPLAQGGLNDVSNLQLLCASCNLKKNKHAAITSPYYESWY